MPSFSMSVLENLVDEINNTHRNFSLTWLSEQETKYNLKKKRIDHVVESDGVILLSFLKIINSYHSSLLSLHAELEFEYSYSEFEIRTRVKQKDSIINKLIQYRIDNDEGKISINKCLNDIFGLRIIFDDLNHECPEFNKNIKILEDKFSVKAVKNNKEGYVGTHLYFKNENNCKFPWELQIWSKDDEQKNNESHKKHKSKRKYTTWPEVYTEEMAFERSETT